MSNAGLLTGIRDVTQGRGLDIKPYLVGTSESFPGRDDAEDRNEAQVGVDLFYNITPSLRTNLTVNTDFTQTQVERFLLRLYPQLAGRPGDRLHVHARPPAIFEGLVSPQVLMRCGAVGISRPDRSYVSPFPG